MSLYIINYDLNEKKINYKKLFNELQYIGALQLTKQTWFIKKRNTHAATLRNYFIQFIHETDSLIVSKIQELAPHQTKNLPKDFNNS